MFHDSLSRFKIKFVLLGRVNALKWMLAIQFSSVSMIADTGDTGLHKACQSLQETCPTEAIPKFRQILPLMEQVSQYIIV